MSEAEMFPAGTLYQCYACRRLVWIGPGDGKSRPDGGKPSTYELRSSMDRPEGTLFVPRRLDLCPDCDLLLRVQGSVETRRE